jgi:hypothetical protein
MGLLGDATANQKAESRINEIRQAMADSLADIGDSHQVTKLCARVMHARDIQSLWYLRADVMTLLAGPLGETVAKDRVSAITKMFDGLLPSGQKSRHSHLHR